MEFIAQVPLVKINPYLGCFMPEGNLHNMILVHTLDFLDSIYPGGHEGYHLDFLKLNGF